jgi:organic hydroperoxide reductase OsmC/OhrA
MGDARHDYDTTVTWTQTRQGTLAASGRASVAIGAPSEFGGSDDVWSPEHLCVAAVNACVMLTFLTIAQNSKVPVQAYTASATGSLEKVEGRGPVITRIVVKPRVTIGADVDRGKVERLIKMAEKNCYISNSLNGDIRLEPEIVVA